MSSGSFLIAIGGDSENRVITSGDGLWLDDFAASTDHIPLTGLSSNREGVVNWNVFPTNGNVELPRFGHELTWLRGVPPYSNYFAYYYLASREYDGIDALSTSALRAGTPTGFPNLVSALAANGFNISQLRVRFGLMTLGNDDALVWSYDPAQRVENRRYQGGIVRFQLNGQDLIAGPMPDFTFTIRYNQLNNHSDDQISGVTGTVSPTNSATGSSSQVQAVAAALLADIGPGAIRLVMDSIQPEIQVEFSQPEKGRIGGFFEAQSGRIELIGLPNAQAAPVITTQPAAQTASLGGAVTFAVMATGEPAPTYQWKHNGVSISAATSATLTLTNVQLTYAGSYTVVVSNAAGSVTSNAATLTVNTPATAPTITAHPASQTLGVGATLTLSVGASGTAPFTYQWRKGGANLSGATNATFTIAAVATGDAGNYDVVVTNSAGSVTSTAATLTVNTPATAPTITAHPASQTLGVGATLTLSVGASGTAPFTYQWKKGGANLSGATNATFTIAAVATGDADSYTVVVSNTAGSATSNAAVITVLNGTYGATHAVVGAGYQSPGTVTITNTFKYSDLASAVGWSVLLPDGWSFASTTSGDSQPRANDTSALTWAWITAPYTDHTFTYTLNVPAGQTATQQLVALFQFRQNNTLYQVLAKPDPLPVSKVTFHSADTMGATVGSAPDYKINLPELLRVIELYNYRAGTVRTGQYTIQSGTEDGFTPGPNGIAITTVFHSADTMGGSVGTPRDGKLNLSELLRVIELYNYRAGTVRTGQYHVQAGTEDGFAPGP
jgi:hypothetical protein